MKSHLWKKHLVKVINDPSFIHNFPTDGVLTNSQEFSEKDILHLNFPMFWQFWSFRKQNIWMNLKCLINNKNLKFKRKIDLRSQWKIISPKWFLPLMLFLSLGKSVFVTNFRIAISVPLDLYLRHISRKKKSRVFSRRRMPRGLDISNKRVVRQWNLSLDRDWKGSRRCLKIRDEKRAEW